MYGLSSNINNSNYEGDDYNDYLATPPGGGYDV